jgi:hypothetical protein
MILIEPDTSETDALARASSSHLPALFEAAFRRRSTEAGAFSP